MPDRRRRFSWVGARTDDVRNAVRSIWRTPTFSIGVIATLALGLGVNAAMFGIVDRLLLRPPDHVQAPERVSRLLVDRYIDWAGRRFLASSITFSDYQDLQQAETLSMVAAYSGRTVTVGRGEGAHEATAQLVSGGYFRLLGIRPAAGRLLDDGDDGSAATPACVISLGYWRRHFGADSSALGQTLEIGSKRYTIVGVAPPGFTGPNLEPVQLWLPLSTAGRDLMAGDWEHSRNYWWLEVIARLGPDVTAEQAAAEATLLHRRARAEMIEAGEYDAEATVVAAPLLAGRGPMASRESRVAKWLAGVSLLVLIIACANVGNLLLARGLRRSRETGIRLALGIARRRLLGQVLVESLLLSMAGGLIAVLLARWGGDLLGRLMVPDVAWEHGFGGLRIAAFVSVAAVTAGLAAGAVPALQVWRGSPLALLGGSSRSLTRPTTRFLSSLAALQACLSVILLVGAGLFVRSLQNVRNLDLGLDPDDILVARPVIEAGVLSYEERRALIDRVAGELSALPGVELTSVSGATPFFSSIGHQVYVPGRDSIPIHSEGGPYLHVVGEDYFELLGLRITEGRGFEASDGPGAPPVVVINPTMARHLWPDAPVQDALGRCLHIGEQDAPCAVVIGVVEEARRQSLREDPSPQYYVSLAQNLARLVPEAILVRTQRRATNLAGAVRGAFLAADPAIRHVQVQTLREAIDPQQRPWTLGASVFGLFGVLAVLVAGIGLYSILAFTVAQRRRELGIRAALGASPPRLIRTAMGRGLWVAATGGAAGILISLAVAPRLGPLLFDVSPRDPAVFATVASALALVALAAGGLPGWRAARVDPAEVLRID